MYQIQNEKFHIWKYSIVYSHSMPAKGEIRVADMHTAYMAVFPSPELQLCFSNVKATIVALQQIDYSYGFAI